MSIFQNTETLTARRNAYAESLFGDMARKAAQDIESGDMLPKVVIPAIAKMVAPFIKNTGKGHASYVESLVRDAVESHMTAPLGEETEES